MNKKLLFYPFLILLIIGCESGFLDPEPLSIYTPENTFDRPEALESVLSSCEVLMREEYLSFSAPLITELIFSDVTVFGKTDAASPAQNLNLSITPDSQLNNASYNRIGWWWDQGYRAIKNANTVIARIDEPEYASEAQRNAILGAAYFHRAYRYYGLTHQFGDVPLILNEIVEPRVDFYSTEREVILQKMKEDLEFAVEWLSDDVPRGQVTRGAAGHLLTKVNLALGLFDDAIASASDVINSGYALMTDRFGIDADDPERNVTWDLHRPQNKAIAENTEALMLTIDRDDVNGSTSSASQLMYATVPQWHNQINTPNGNKGTLDQPDIEYDQVTEYGRGVAQARGTAYSTKIIWENAGDDLRFAKGNWMTMEDLVYNNINIKGSDPYYGQPLQKYSDDGQLLTSDSIRAWFDWPHYKLYVDDNRYVPARGGHTDYYVYRLAETYLLRAEAHYWNDDLSSAAADINMVRERANAEPFTPTEINIRTILDERARELYYEEPRNIELTRMAYLFAKTGKTSYLGTTYSLDNFSENNFWFDHIMEVTDFYNQGVRTNYGNEFTMSSYHVLWPIPASTINANTNGVINQNWGYTGYERNVPPLTEIEE